MTKINKKLKKLWNNKIFRTFFQTVMSSVATYLGSITIFNELNINALACVVISAMATAFCKIMPSFDIEETEEK